MFVHSKSGKCKLASCNENDIETVASEDSEHESESEDEHMNDSSSVCCGENDCHLCEMTFTCLDDLCEHFRCFHQEYYQETQLLVVV